MKKTIIIAIGLLLLSLVAVFPFGNGEIGVNVEGTLKSVGNDWYLVAKDQEFLLNFKSVDLTKEQITLQDGETIIVHGFLEKNEIIPCRILYKDKSYYFPENHDENCYEQGHGWGRKGRGRRGW